MLVARLTFPEAPGPRARLGGLPAHSRSPLSERGGSSRDSGNKEVEARARARIPGTGGASAPRPRPATHGAESRPPLLLPSSESRYGVGKGKCRSSSSLCRLLTDACRGPRGSSPGEPEEESKDTSIAAALVRRWQRQQRQQQQHTTDRQGDPSRRPSRRTGSGQRRVTA